MDGQSYEKNFRAWLGCFLVVYWEGWMLQQTNYSPFGVY